jgi:hypothetical protein
MRHSKLIRLLFAAAGISWAQSGTISGTVVESNGDPVSKAIVTLTLQGTPRQWATERTDGSGRFKFEHLPGGKYDLRANKNGIGTAIYGANSTRELGETIVLDAGETRANLKLRFIHTSTISGRVLDPDGDPILGANVSLMRGGRNLGQRVLAIIRQTLTNDRGEYQIPGVEPGQYYMHVTYDSPGRQMGDLRLLGHQYYGGATESKDAAPINITGGENLVRCDFQLKSVTGAQVSGHIKGLPDNAPDPQEGPHEGKLVSFVEIYMSPADDVMRGWRQGAAVQPTDGHFQFPEVAAGRYRIYASAVRDKRVYSAWQMIDAQPGVGDVVLNMVPGTKLNGQIVIEGGSNLKPSEFHVSFTSIESQSLSAEVGPTGNFVFNEVAIGEWQMDLTPPPRGGYLKSVHLGDKDVRFGKLLIEPGSDAQLKIVVSTRMASIEGETGSKRAGILVAPIGAFHDLARFYYAVPTDDEGKFKLMGIAPGKYRVFALEKMAAANFRSPEAADQLGDLGEEVDLTEGAHVTVHPKLIPIERAREALP